MSSTRPKTGSPLAILGTVLVLVLFVLAFVLVRWTGHAPSAGLVEGLAAPLALASESSPRELEAPELAEGAVRARDAVVAAGVPASPPSEVDAARLALLSQSYVVRGRIVDAAGNPVPGAAVSLGCKRFENTEPGSTSLEFGLSDGTSAQWTWTKSDERGRFRFAQGGTRDTFEVQARKPALGVAAVELSGPAVAVSDVDFGDIVLGPALELRGRVARYWSGESVSTPEPYAGVEVELTSSGFRNFRADESRTRVRGKTSVVTAPDGSFAFEGLLPGRYLVVALVDELGNALAAEPVSTDTTPASRRRVRVGRPAPRPMVGVTLPSTDSEPIQLLVSRRAVLRGQVVLPDGRAVTGAEVEVHGPVGAERVQTDGTGRFEISGLGRVPVKLSVWPPQAAKDVLRVTELDGVVPGAREVRVVLASASFIEGRVVGADGQPVAFVGVTATSAARKELDFAYTDEQGRFRLRVPVGEAIELEACPTLLKSANVRTLDRASPLRGRAGGVRAGVSDLVLRLERK